MRYLAVALFLSLVPLGCSTELVFNVSHDAGDRESLSQAVAVIEPTEGHAARGTVTFEQDGEDVIVTAHIGGLEPGSEHAWHIHEYGDVRGADGKATGGHYNPEGHPHALPTEETRHAGDLGNLVADAQGLAVKSVTVHNISINGLHNPIIGRAIIVHASRDDGGQPTGNAGARIAQGVIGFAKEM